MKVKFKIWNNRLKSFDTTNKFMIDMEGRLYVLDGSIFITCGDWMKPVFSTGKEDENGVELFEGDIVEWFDHDFCDLNNGLPERCISYIEFTDKIKIAMEMDQDSGGDSSEPDK